MDNPALDALLAEYAAGSLAPALHVLVASHLALSRRGRRFVSSLESAGGGDLARALPAPLADRDRMLSAIVAEDAPDLPEPAATDDLTPGPLAALLAGGVRRLPWRRLMPGVRRHVVDASGDSEAALFWIKPGRKMPSHTHEGLEVTLILQGGITDVTGHYRRGDVSIADPEVDHRPITDPDEDCICFAVAEGRRPLTGRVGRWVQRVLPRRV